MFHTTTCTASLLVVTIGAAAGLHAQKQGVNRAQSPEVKKVIDRLQAVEKGLKTLSLTLETVGSYPSGREYRTQGLIRVLGTTHFHVRVEASFGASRDIRSEVEKVVTPTGVWTRQLGPIESVFTKIEPALMRRLQTAQQALAAADKARPGATVPVPGYLAEGGQSPLGSEMVLALDRTFELTLAKEPKTLRGEECTVLQGPWRGLDKENSVPADRLGPHRVEIYIRKDGIPIEMRQFDRSDKVMLQLSITKIDLAPKLDAGEFVLKVPEGTVFRDAMDHRPSRAQIERVLGEYESLKKSEKPGEGKQK